MLCIPFVVETLKINTDDDELLVFAARSLSLALDNILLINKNVDLTFLARVVELLKFVIFYLIIWIHINSRSNRSIVIPCLLCLGNICIQENFIQHVIDNGAVTPIKLLIGILFFFFALFFTIFFLANSPDRDVRKKALWVISNITVGNIPQVEQLLKEEGIIGLYC
jgi:hypothetical protein